jgi:hypothetical protein
MSTINKDKYSGGTGLATGELAKDLQDVADDLAATKAPTVSAAEASATAAADIVAIAAADAVATVVNELRTDLNAIAGGTLKTQKGTV